MRKQQLKDRLGAMMDIVDQRMSMRPAEMELAYFRQCRWEFLNHLEREFDRERLNFKGERWEL